MVAKGGMGVRRSAMPAKITQVEAFIVWYALIDEKATSMVCKVHFQDRTIASHIAIRLNSFFMCG